MSKRISNTSIIDAINLFFYKKGQKLTNLQKANREKLDSIIKKYNINLDELLVEVNLINEKEKEEKQKREEERKREAEEEAKKQKEKEEILMMKWNTLSLEDKESIKNIHYNRYVEETLKDNEIAIKSTDKMEKEAREKEAREKSPTGFIQRINENTFCIRGINVINGWYEKIKSREEYEMPEDWIAKYHYNQKLINELYEVEMIKQGFQKGEDGDFYKTIIVKRKNKTKIKKEL
jgi:hypothetical protein